MSRNTAADDSTEVQIGDVVRYTGEYHDFELAVVSNVWPDGRVQVKPDPDDTLYTFHTLNADDYTFEQRPEQEELDDARHRDLDAKKSRGLDLLRELRAGDDEIAGQFCTECDEFRDHSTPVKVSHSRTGRSGCPECLNDTLRYVVEQPGDERTVTGGYIPSGQRDDAFTVEHARARAEGRLVTDGGHPHADDTAAEFEEVSDDDAEHVSEIDATRECAMCGSSTSRSSRAYYFKHRGELTIAEDWSCPECDLQGTILRRRSDGEIVRMSHLHTGSGFEYPDPDSDDEPDSDDSVRPVDVLDDADDAVDAYRADDEDGPATDGGRDPGEQIGRVADRATDSRGSIDEHVDLRVTATLPALDDETVTFTTVVVSVVDDDEYGVGGRYVRLGCEGASDAFIDLTGTECHDLSATFDRDGTVDAVGGSYVSGKDDSGQLVYDELEVESVEIVDEEE